MPVNQELGWVPLPHVTDRTEGLITVGHTGMPVGMDVERIELNTHALNTGVIKLGGYASMTLSAYNGDADQYSYSAEVPDASGASRATGVATETKAESLKMVSDFDKRRNIRNVRNGNLGIHWNMSALNGRIEVGQQYDPRIRAKQLGKIIKISSTDAVIKHNIQEVLDSSSKAGFRVLAAFDTIALYPIVNSLVEGHHIAAAQGLAVRVASMKILAPMFYSTMYQHDFKDNIHDFLLLAFRPTRATAAAGYLAAHKLVRAAK